MFEIVTIIDEFTLNPQEINGLNYKSHDNLHQDNSIFYNVKKYAI